MKRLLYALLTGLVISSLADAEIDPSRRHVVIVEGGIDRLWGTYLFAVDNDGKKPERAKFPVMLPVETLDWRIQDGLTPEEIKLTDDGKVMIDKEFPPGSTLIGLSFNAPAEYGKAKLSFKAQTHIDHFMIMVPEDDQVKVSAEGMEVKAGVPFSKEVFLTLNQNEILPGTEIKADFDRVPEGRQRLWLLGAGVGILLVLCGGIFAFVTKPKMSEATTEF